MIRVTNIVQSGYLVLLDQSRVKIYEVTLQYQDALGSSELIYQFREDELSAASIKETLKDYTQDRKQRIEMMERLNKDLL